MVPAAAREYGPAQVRRLVDDVLFRGFSSVSDVWMSHGDQIGDLAGQFQALAALAALSEWEVTDAHGGQYTREAPSRGCARFAHVMRRVVPALFCCLAAAAGASMPVLAEVSRAQELRARVFKLITDGTQAYKDGRNAEAIKMLEEAAGIALNSFKAYYYLGLALKADRQYQRAIDPLQIAKISAVLMNIALGWTAIHAVYVNRSFVPRELRSSGLMQVGSIVCGIFFLVTSAIVFYTM